MWTHPEAYDVIVVGGGHAGCEAAFAAAKMGASTLLITMNLDTIGKMSCNPAVGGVAKGHIVREIDALGGLMGKVIDCTGIQYRMLNASKGPSVWSPRAQADKWAYQHEIKHRLEKTPNLQIKQGTTEALFTENNCVKGIDTLEGIRYLAKSVVLTTGTFMRGLLHIGETNFAGGRAGDKPSVGLSASLMELGFKLGRLKTGTPCRINRRSINFALTEEQKGDEGVYFSYDPQDKPRLPQIACHITYTNEKTKEVILNNIHRSPMYSGTIKGVGPRYCPSIEDKVVRFSDKERHQIFLEPEGLNTEEVYVNGLSSSLPFDVQLAFIRSISALEKAEIMRPAYAIEYDYIVCGQVKTSLETKLVENLFVAGQINGTSGYEEAGGQGLIAGINAANKVRNQPALILKRSEAYIGVMIDDLVTKELEEPYRMFTSRAEHRLCLRQDNADLRLRRYGYNLGLINAEQYARLQHKEQTITSELNRLGKIYKQMNGKGFSLVQLLARPENTYNTLLQEFPEQFLDHGADINLQIELAVKYQGYLERQQNEIDKLQYLEEVLIPANFNFRIVKALSNEAKEKLSKVQPHNLGQASRIMGVSPADVSILLVALKNRGQRLAKEEEDCSCC
ncbi:MAG: mnmG [Chlamydiales bacterium]|jgi:tRNA uridine 5-carboxymethylaminomethyl modification enzyme|nr:mnmG [Chlamydiales bacterium]